MLLLYTICRLQFKTAFSSHDGFVIMLFVFLDSGYSGGWDGAGKLQRF